MSTSKMHHIKLQYSEQCSWINLNSCGCIIEIKNLCGRHPLTECLSSPRDDQFHSPVKRDKLLDPCHQRSQTHVACSPQAQSANPQELTEWHGGGSTQLRPVLGGGVGGGAGGATVPLLNLISSN